MRRPSVSTDISRRVLRRAAMNCNSSCCAFALAVDSYLFRDPAVKKWRRTVFDRMVEPRDSTALYIHYHEVHTANRPVEEIRAALDPRLTLVVPRRWLNFRAHRWGWLGLKQSESRYHELIQQAVAKRCTEAIAEVAIDCIREHQAAPKIYIDLLMADYHRTLSSRVRDAVEAITDRRAREM